MEQFHSSSEPLLNLFAKKMHCRYAQWEYRDLGHQAASSRIAENGV